MSALITRYLHGFCVDMSKEECEGTAGIPQTSRIKSEPVLGIQEKSVDLKDDQLVGAGEGERLVHWSCFAGSKPW